MANKKIEARALEEARYFVDNNSTIRATAKAFGYSKSSVHLDLTQRLPFINPILYDAVSKILKTNTEERHIRGGLSTQQKYLNLKKEN